VVKVRLHPAVLVGLVLLLCVTVVCGLVWLRGRRVSTQEALLAHFPPEEGAILSINFEALRDNGALAALAGAGVSQEPEYKAFIDYQQDLDMSLVWLGRRTTSMLLRGRFDWRRLAAYVARHGGVCRNSFCRLEGSAPERKISFFPLQRNVMALSVSPDAWAASALAAPKPARRDFAPPGEPLWLWIPPSVLRDSERLPAGTRLFVKAMENAESLLLSLSLPPAKMELRLEAACRTPEDASLLAFQLDGVTRLLRDLIARENGAPNPRDLSGLLAAGTFQASDRRVSGRWPVQQAFIESLLGAVP
jgi:hypothetical protein